MATKKYLVYYKTSALSHVNRAYPEYDDTLTDDQIKAKWLAENAGTGRIYLIHEPHDDYTSAFAAAGMVGKDPSVQRTWLAHRVNYLKSLVQAAAAAKAATLIPGTGTGYGGAKPGDIVRDQHGRSGRVPNVPLEVFRDKPIDPDVAHKAIQDLCKGG